MTASHLIDPTRFLSEQLEQASPDLMRQMLTTFINGLMSAEAEAVCGAEYGQISADQVNSRNGYRHPHRNPRRHDPEATHRHLLPGLAPRAPPPR